MPSKHSRILAVVAVLLLSGFAVRQQTSPFTALAGDAEPNTVDASVGTTITYQESVLDEATLQQVADITGGKFFRAEDTSTLQAIYDEINQLEKSQVEVQVFNQYHELMIWLLVPALLILLLETVLRNTIFRKVP